ncbi:MAG: DUF4493 domain-containing protein [Bacteroidales bacterium]|nr:DUF4493 domain-containing protein [Bacteroidales bacterium]
MKNTLTGALAAAAILLCLTSCSILPDEGKGELRLHFANEAYARTKASNPEIPDTSAFLITVTDAGGNVIYDGTFGASPESLLVDPGSYTVCARSIVFSGPKFSAPQYGDDQCVIVKAGAVTDVRLSCSQMNSGIRLKIAPDFLDSYPDGVLYVSSADGKLMYAYKETRTAFFRPGEVSILLTRGSREERVFTRELAAKEILTVRVSAPGGNSSTSGGNLSIAVDTTRNWTAGELVLGGQGSGDRGTDKEKAMDISTARSNIGAENVWVYGYIAGAFKSSGNIVFEEPFPSATNLAITSRASSTSKESCLSVELRKGDLRDELNLFDHPSYKGRKVFLRGDIVESYYGIPGVKNITRWSLE